MTIKLSEDEKAGFDVLSPHMPEDLAIDIIKHRRAKKAKLTARVARSLLREYQAYGNVEKAAEIHLTRGWVSFECDWAKKPGMFNDSMNPIAKAETPQQRTERLDLFNQYRFARDEGNAQKAAEIRAKLNQAMQRVQ